MSLISLEASTLLFTNSRIFSQSAKIKKQFTNLHLLRKYLVPVLNVVHAQFSEAFQVSH
jgi:hypothetical protein